jgi:hypothetical protein
MRNICTQIAVSTRNVTQLRKSFRFPAVKDWKLSLEANKKDGCPKKA